MKVILKQDIKGVGKKDQIIKTVKDGEIFDELTKEILKL